MKITMTDFVNKRYRTDRRFDCFYSAVSALRTSLMVADIDSNFQQLRISLIGIICSSFFFILGIFSEYSAFGTHSFQLITALNIHFNYSCCAV